MTAGVRLFLRRERVALGDLYAAAAVAEQEPLSQANEVALSLMLQRCWG